MAVGFAFERNRILELACSEEGGEHEASLLFGLYLVKAQLGPVDELGVSEFKAPVKHLSEHRGLLVTL